MRGVMRVMVVSLLLYANARGMYPTTSDDDLDECWVRVLEENSRNETAQQRERRTCGDCCWDRFDACYQSSKLCRCCTWTSIGAAVLLLFAGGYFAMHYELG